VAFEFDSGVAFETAVFHDFDETPEPDIHFIALIPGLVWLQDTQKLPPVSRRQLC